MTSADAVLKYNEALCRDWLSWLQAHGRSPITIHQYGARCEELLRFLGRTRLDDVTLDQLEEWIARPRQGRGRGQLGSDSTRAKEVLICRGLWRWAIAHGRLMNMPTEYLELPAVRDEDPRAIDPDLWHTFWITPLLTDIERVVFGLGFYCGLRRAEICQLEIGHVDIDMGRIVGFRRKGDRGKKTGDVNVLSLARFFAQEHPSLLPSADGFLRPFADLYAARSAAGARWLIPWGEEAVDRPQAYRLPGGRNGILGADRRSIPDGMTSPDQINGRLLRALKRSGLPERSFSPHALRHSFVTYLLRANVTLEVVSKLANHSSADITLRYCRLADDPLGAKLTVETLRGSRWEPRLPSATSKTIPQTPTRRRRGRPYG